MIDEEKNTKRIGHAQLPALQKSAIINRHSSLQSDRREVACALLGARPYFWASLAIPMDES
jgi:hypothetical protein